MSDLGIEPEGAPSRWPWSVKPADGHLSPEAQKGGGRQLWEQRWEFTPVLTSPTRSLACVGSS